MEIRTDSKQIKGWDCDCPYDHGPICKHVVATFYAIVECIELEKTIPKQGAGKKKRNRKDRIEDLFKNASKEALQQFIVSQFRRDYGLKNAFIAHFAELLNEDQNEKYHTIVRNIYKAAQGRHGFVDYYSARTLTVQLSDLAEKSEELLVKKNITEALALCKTLIEEVPIVVYNMDDSDGGASSVIDYAFNTFFHIAEQAPPILKDELFDYCLSEYPKEKYHDFGFEDEFLRILPLLITLEEQEKQFFELINQQIELEKKNDFSDYRIVKLIKTKIDYLQRAKREDEAQVLIETNINYADFREILLNQAISKKEFNLAEKLCNEGIAIAKMDQHPGIENKWYIKLLEISEKKKSKEEIRKWSEKLYFDNYFDMEYYQKLKSTYSKDKWSDKSEEIINKLKGKNQKGGYGEVRALAEIFIEEKYTDRLLKLLQINSKKISFIDEYADYLKKSYPKDLLTFYEEGVKRYAKSTGRDIYNEAANYLEKMKKINPLIFMIILSVFLLPGNLTADVQTNPTPTGLWITCIGDSNVLGSLEEMENVISFAKSAGFDRFFLQIYRGDEAWFDSQVADSSPFEKNRTALKTDSLRLFIQKAHAQGIEVHAWLNTLTLSKNRNAKLLKESGSKILTKDQHDRPALNMKPGAKKSLLDQFYMRENQLFLEPGDPSVRKRILNITNEIVQKYPEIDGLHYDYIRYPASPPYLPGSRFNKIGLSYGYGEENVRRYTSQTGLDPKKV
ncbi:MAG: family 10 glycosylhydrolase, partial [Bacteroidetes bacterium]|nr:family 10 glycosylhydrolase [Bacteroidota bacterium]